MPLSWNEIRNRAHEFSRKWEGEESERAEAQSFWNDFFAVFGIERKRVAIFEKQVQIARAGEVDHARMSSLPRTSQNTKYGTHSPTQPELSDGNRLTDTNMGMYQA